jgi:3-deoxy-7-phosphoheptulonate synthase
MITFAGPCGIESQEQAERIASEISKYPGVIFRGGVYKGQNRPIVRGKPCFWGIGDDGMRILKRIKDIFNIKVSTEVQSIEQLSLALKYDIDYLQVGARHMQNFPLIRALSHTLKPIILKRGLGNTVDEWLGIAEHLRINGSRNVIMCERGVVGFDRTNDTRWRLDCLAIAEVKYQFPEYTVIADISHGTGRRELALPMAKAAIGAGADGIMVEVHYDPDSSPTDARQTVDFNQFKQIMSSI